MKKKILNSLGTLIFIVFIVVCLGAGLYISIKAFIFGWYYILLATAGTLFFGLGGYVLNELSQRLKK